ncbi:3-dehydroquinate synthase [[Limnothrix rosea] IAM M-220]|uniref:3-dehydroquinate synthase n=1 Tax=[Limnothrix rosea] IAM M-220 TaxID=454133 RepID=UPI000958F358|nr:3-dehydroquinate synthase [[Limnothrix rosea] IAM M-220]OKH17030.1 3-dehydroquinate synthase [[Limnothrix rosea] IAM M-220]
MDARIRVELGENSYDIAIANGKLGRLGLELSQLNLGKKILIISNPEIFGHYGETVVGSLVQAGFEVCTHLIAAGEEYKNLTSIQQIYDTALENRIERSSTFLALGGGVIGDMTGFAAATWLRGINFVQVPTSLLAMVDASVGGKTGVNHPQGKNLIGAFYQPKFVMIDPTVLETLPLREFRAGMAEVIKYGVIWDRELFKELEIAESIDSYETISADLLDLILERSCQAKADVVGQDERESGIRAILNYGHTLGHAVESLTHYKQFVHGEGVAIGMALAGAIAMKMSLWTSDEVQRQDALIQKAGLPVDCPEHLQVGDILRTLQSDKKVRAGKVRFILPTKIGEVLITDQVRSELIEDVLTPMSA